MTSIIFAMCTMVALSVIGGAIILCSSNEYETNREEEDKWETK